MTTAEKTSNGEAPTPSQVRRGRRTALLLFAIGFGPMVLATVMFYTGWLNPDGHSNQGRLISPPVPVADLGLTGVDGQPVEQRFVPEQEDRRWLLMVVSDRCDNACEEMLYLARQVNIALGKNASRVDRAAWLGSVPGELDGRWNQGYRLMERLEPGAGGGRWPDAFGSRDEPSILLVDPLGNVMMQYTSDHTGKQMLKDLKHLLKLSTIG